MTAANDSTVGAVAASAGGGTCWKFFSPSPTAIKNIITMGIQATRSYLKCPCYEYDYARSAQTDEPMEDLPAAEGNKQGYDSDNDDSYAAKE
jgi:hypothetical protein